MRLIDLDELIATIEVDMEVSVTGEDNMKEVRRMMKNVYSDVLDSPVIDAIPVEWLRNKQKTVIRKLNGTYTVIDELIGEWNAKNNNL